jgi:hypothetical protein
MITAWSLGMLHGLYFFCCIGTHSALSMIRINGLDEQDIFYLSHLRDHVLPEIEE